jgi:esterase/lipase
MFRLTGALAVVGLIFTSVHGLSGCASADKIATVTPAVSFADYQRDTRDRLRARRNFQSTDYEAELMWNGPGEWRPTSTGVDSRPEKGILLVHGLGDSPWTFHDLAPQLAAQGFLVRTVLLPGHGTHPEDLMDITLEDWRRVIQEQTGALRRDVRQVYLGGFSTGANLVVEYAYANPDIAGLVLFSPGFKSLPFDWIAPWVARVRPWILTPDGSVPLQNVVRYMNVPSNGFAQFYYSSRAARQLLDERPYDKPVFMVVAQHDSVLNTSYLLDVFQRRFTNPASRLIWYGTAPAGLKDASRILIRDDRFPEQRISQFSHMGLPFSPANPLYGQNGAVRVCVNGQDASAMRACEAGAPVWYSDWGYRDGDKIFARLTFNPYFDWQASVLATVFDRNVPLVSYAPSRSPQ